MKSTVDGAETKPSLLYGETAQGFMNPDLPAKRVADPFRGRSLSPLQLESYL